MKRIALVILPLAFTATFALAGNGCIDDRQDCAKLGKSGEWPCDPVIDDTTASGGGGVGGQGGAGGGLPCDAACSDDTPICNTDTEMCVACLEDSHCTDVAASRCAGDFTCQPCMVNMDCEGLSGTSVCDAGTCVECSAVDTSACGATQTCDLLQNVCVDVAPESLTTCSACTNDAQCSTDHRCVPMQFQDAPHGHYCLRIPDPTCARPYTTPISQPSVNGEAAQSYCGINEALATCEAVIALIGGWVCTGMDGMCSPMMGDPEVAVPGTICRQVGLEANQCTYACGDPSQCLDSTMSPAKSTCGTGTQTPPGWCGG